MSYGTFMGKLLNDIERTGRHLKIMKIIEREGPIGIIKLSEKTRLPSHKVRYSLRVLENNKLVKPSSAGAVITENAKEFIRDMEEKIKEIRDKINELAEDLLPR